MKISLMSGLLNREVGIFYNNLAILVPTLGLLAFGLFFLYSFGLAFNDLGNFYRQTVFALIGLVVFAFFARFDYRFCRSKSVLLPAYISLVALLAGLLLFAEPVRGARAWYRIGPLSVDPIEPLKIVFIIILANYFSAKHIEMYRIANILISAIYLLLPALLIFYQPNFGSALVLALIWLGVLLVSGVKLRHFFLLLLASLVLAGFGWEFLLHDYQKSRLVSFLWPHTSPLEAAWQQTQAKITIGEGGLLGRGSGGGEQVKLGFLPEAQTDFIFAGIAGQFGLLGAGAILALFGLLLWQIIKVTAQSQDNFSRLYSSGLAIMFLSHIGINIGMNLGLLPIIGISLPFVSYGGSSLITNFAALGILANIFSLERR